MPKKSINIKKPVRYCQCGNEISQIEWFNELPCNKYCCGCCPHREEDPCPNHQKFGGILENLAKWQGK